MVARNTAANSDSAAFENTGKVAADSFRLLLHRRFWHVCCCCCCCCCWGDMCLIVIPAELSRQEEKKEEGESLPPFSIFLPSSSFSPLSPAVAEEGTICSSSATVISKYNAVFFSPMHFWGCVAFPSKENSYFYQVMFLMAPVMRATRNKGEAHKMPSYLSHEKIFLKDTSS